MSLESNNNKDNKETNKEPLVCPNAPKITIYPVQNKIPYVNVIKDEDSDISEEQKEKPIKQANDYKKENDDRYDDDDSFDDSFNAEQETKTESGNLKEGPKKFKEGSSENNSQIL